MSDKVSYNKTALTDVINSLSSLLEEDYSPLVIETVNAGHAKDKLVECIEMYNTIDTNLYTLIQQTLTMAQNVKDAVDEIEGS